MKKEKQLIKKICNRKRASGIAVRLVLVVFSFVQAHWAPIACAAGTVAAAKMFGDKGYWANIDKEAEKIIAEQKPVEAVKSIEAELAKYLKWIQENPDQVSYLDEKINDCYFQLTKAKEAAGFAKKEVVSGYKRAITSPDYGGEALEWLFRNVSADEYKDCIKTALQASYDSGRNFGTVAKQIESKGNWAAFNLFLNVAFDKTKDPIAVAKSIENGLRSDSAWKDRFIEYCRSKPNLLEYAYQKDCEAAEAYEKKGDFKSAAKAYRGIIKQYDLNLQESASAFFKICKCFFGSGEYQQAISEIDQFLAINKATNRSLSKEAMLMKGRCYIQLGKMDKAVNEFFTLTIEYPETKEASESNFFIGYCCMLQGKFEQAKEALNLVVKDYPQSSFASKARLCLTRIESMTK